MSYLEQTGHAFALPKPSNEVDRQAEMSMTPQLPCTNTF